MWQPVATPSTLRCAAQVQKLGRKLKLPITWNSRRDHLDPSLREYKARCPRRASMLWCVHMRLSLAIAGSQACCQHIEVEGFGVGVSAERWRVHCDGVPAQPGRRRQPGQRLQPSEAGGR